MGHSRPCFNGCITGFLVFFNCFAFQRSQNFYRREWENMNFSKQDVYLQEMW